MNLKNIIGIVTSSIVIGILYFTGMIGALVVVLYHRFAKESQIIDTNLMLMAFACFFLVVISVVLTRISDINENDFWETSTMRNITAVFSFVVIAILLRVVLWVN